MDLLQIVLRIVHIFAGVKRKLVGGAAMFTKSARYIALAFVSLLLLSACGPAQTPERATTLPLQGAVLDQEFTLKLGQTLDVAGTGLAVSFSNVLEDSRCPKDVLCEWAGQAEILAQVQQADIELVLGPYTNADRATYEYEGYQLQFVRLDPYPETIEEPIVTGDYEATFIVTHATNGYQH